MGVEITGHITFLYTDVYGIKKSNRINFTASRYVYENYVEAKINNINLGCYGIPDWPLHTTITGICNYEAINYFYTDFIKDAFIWESSTNIDMINLSDSFIVDMIDYHFIWRIFCLCKNRKYPMMLRNTTIMQNIHSYLVPSWNSDRWDVDNIKDFYEQFYDYDDSWKNKDTIYNDLNDDYRSFNIVELLIDQHKLNIEVEIQASKE